jgi:hypothetical protein
VIITGNYKKKVMKLVYMEQTLQLIAKTQGVEVAKAIEETGGDKLFRKYSLFSN